MTHIHVSLKSSTPRRYNGPGYFALAAHLLLWAGLPLQIANAEIFVVISDGDVVDLSGCDDTHCSLREALNAANATAAFDEIQITFPNPNWEVNVSEQLLIEQPVTIRTATPGLPRASIDGARSGRVFEVSAGATVRLEQLALGQGAADQGGTILNAGNLTLSQVYVSSGEADAADTFGDGGCIYNTAVGSLYLVEETTVENCLANFGGAIYNNGGFVEIRDSTVRDSTASGHPLSNGGNIRNWQGGRVEIYDSVIGSGEAVLGGNIRNVDEDSTVRIESSFISRGVASDAGGGIWNSGNLDVNESDIQFNSASEENGGEGGGIANFDSGRVSLTEVRLIRNRAQFGGGIFNENAQAQIYLEDTEILANSADFGGGIDNTGSLEINRSALLENDALFGAAIDNSGVGGNVTILNSTVTNNDSDGAPGGIYGAITTSGGSLAFTHTTVFGNTGGGVEPNLQLNGAGASFTASYIEDCSVLNNPFYTINGVNMARQGCVEDDGFQIVDPQIVGLTSDGTPTRVASLQQTSPLIDAVPCVATMVDQRGFDRGIDGVDPDDVGQCDVGAYEWGATPPVSETPIFVDGFEGP